MSPDAIIMIIVAVVCVWGSFGLAILNLRRHPEEPDEAEPAHPGRHQQEAGNHGPP